ncbi:MAG TPA: hypothetical protein VJ372_02375 [Pyrinomonadaceae bacterium]|nr:hypothetical protein [Pyrinomonadaceae bacterium]
MLKVEGKKAKRGTYLQAYSKSGCQKQAIKDDRRLRDARNPPNAIVILNWSEELKRRVAAGK